MHKIDGPGATASNEFTEGNPVTAIPATEVTADWLNTLQREVVAVVEASGQTLDKDDDEQLLEAINTLIEASIPSEIPDASTTIKGIQRNATDAEVIAGLLNNATVTPLALAPALINGGADYKDVKSSRAWNTLYTNTSGRPILVQITVYHLNNGASQLSVGGNIVSAEACGIGGGVNNNLRTTLTAVVKPGATYRLEPGAPIQSIVYPAPTIEQWMEL